MKQQSEGNQVIIQYARSIRLSGRKRYYLLPNKPEIYLTQREAECSVLVLAGCTNKIIAAHMESSPRTVEFYLKNIRTKLACYSKAHLTRRLHELDFLSLITQDQAEIFSPKTGRLKHEFIQGMS